MSKLETKRNAVIQAFEMFDIDKERVLLEYPNENLDRKATRKLVVECMNMRISKANEERLNEICSTQFSKESRTPAEYAMNLVYGWLIEDIVYIWLIEKGYSVDKTGADKDREFLSGNKISAGEDLSVNTKAVDIFCDMDGYWSKNNTMDIRMSKYNKLKNDGFIIGISPKFGQVTVIDLKNEKDIEVRNNPLWGGREVATLSGVSSKLFSVKDLDKMLRKVL